MLVWRGEVAAGAPALDVDDEGRGFKNWDTVDHTDDIKGALFSFWLQDDLLSSVHSTLKYGLIVFLLISSSFLDILLICIIEDKLTIYGRWTECDCRSINCLLPFNKTYHKNIFSKRLQRIQYYMRKLFKIKISHSLYAAINSWKSAIL